MANTHINRLRCVVTNTPGTSGNLVVGAAPAGRRGFGASEDGKTFELIISEGNAWEVRTGCVYTHSTTTVTRGALVDSSTGAAINFSAAAVVSLGLTARAMVELEPARQLPPTSTTADIQAAIDAASTAGGGVVRLAPGTFACTNTLVVKSNVVLRGSGRGVTVLRGPAGAYPGVTVNSALVYATVAMVDAQNATVSSLTVDHSTNHTDANGIVIIAGGVTGSGTGCDRCVVQDCQVLGYDSHQYLIWQRRSRNIGILHNYVDGGVTSNTPASQQEGIECYGGSDVLVQGNHVKNVGNNGGYINPDASISGAAVNVRFVDNYFEACRIGVYISPATDVTDIQISRNHVYNAWAAGIKCATAGSLAVNGLSITDNVVRTTPTGISVVAELTNVYSRLSIAGNSVSGVGTGIDIYKAGPGNVVGNVVKTVSSHGIKVEYANAIAVSENTIDTVTLHGIYALNLTGGYLCNNRVFSYAGGGNSNGIRIDTCTNVIADGNYFSWVSLAYPIYASGAGSVAIGNANKTAMSYNGNPVYRNDATNPNFGTFTLTAASTSKVVSNTLVQNSSLVHVIQTGGTLRAFTLSQSTGSFTMTFPAAVGDETFKYVIW